MGPKFTFWNVPSEPFDSFLNFIVWRWTTRGRDWRYLTFATCLICHKLAENSLISCMSWTVPFGPNQPSYPILINFCGTNFSYFGKNRKKLSRKKVRQSQKLIPQKNHFSIFLFFVKYVAFLAANHIVSRYYLLPRKDRNEVGMLYWD